MVSAGEQDLKKCLLAGCYPDNCKTKAEKRNFSRRALKFHVQNDQVYYKKDGANLLALAEKEEQKQAFQVRKTVIILKRTLHVHLCLHVYIIMYISIGHC